MGLKKILVFVNLFFPLISLAAGLVPCGGPGESPCQLCHLFVLLNNVLNFLIKKITFPIAVLMLVIAGLMYLGAIFEFLPGGFETLSHAKKVLTSVVIGLGIIFFAWIFLNLFFMVIGVAEWTGLRNWFRINCP